MGARISLLVMLFAAITQLCVPVEAQHREQVRARFASPAKVALSPQPKQSSLALHGGSTVAFISPDKWNGLSGKLKVTLESLHHYYTDLFGTIPAFEVSVRLMEEDAFYATTGAPSWTNALYYRGQITIPVTENEAIDFDNLARSVKHEFTHAVVHALSGGRCPGWIDEGLAQWAEGGENPALRPALKSWLTRRKPVSFRLLQGGFTKLEPDMVPAAYAQSLYGVKAILGNFGFIRLQGYFEDLREGQSSHTAFEANFDMHEAIFERRFANTLTKWARHDVPLTHGTRPEHNHAHRNRAVMGRFGK